MKFALIQSDFINSEPGQDDDWIDAQVVQTLNTALSDETTYCIIISDVDFSASPLIGMPNTSVVASWEDAIAVMEEKLNQSASTSFHPTIKNN